jgi:hypothetical protein
MRNMKNWLTRLLLIFILHPSSFIIAQEITRLPPVLPDQQQPPGDCPRFRLSENGTVPFGAPSAAAPPDSQPSAVRLLPSVLPDEQTPPGQLVSHPNSSSEIMQSPGDRDVAPATPAPAEPRLPPGVRNGFFQKALFDAGWVPYRGDYGLGMTDLQLQGIFALPCPRRDTPLVLTPGFAVHYLDGPRQVDLPPQLHEGYLDVRWMAQVTPQLGLDVAVTPSIFSDFEQQSSKAFRLPAHAAAAWTLSETTKLVVGAAYLDRFDIEVIPIGGLIWTPCDDQKFDLIFPHPKFSQRIYYWLDRDDDKLQDWVYLAAEFNGDQWAIRRSDGTNDQVVLSDYRIVLGMERKVLGALSSRVEVGYVFGRRVKYASDTPGMHPTEAIMFRAGLTY